MNIHDLMPCLGYKISEGFIGFSKEPQHSAGIDFYSVPRPQHSSYYDGLTRHILKGKRLTTVSIGISSSIRPTGMDIGSEKEMPKNLSSDYRGFIKA